ncbi:MAG: hypothetical protein AAGC55_16620, partial [Myxococcota bacterium]
MSSPSTLCPAVPAAAAGDASGSGSAPSPTAASGQGAAGMPGVIDTPSLRLDGTPAIPDALRQRMSPYLNTRSAALSDLSDDGKQALITTRLGETAQLHLVRTPMGARTQLTFDREPAASGRFVPGEDAILYMSDVGGNEQHQLVRRDLGSGRVTALTAADTRSGGPLWSRDGKQVAFYSTARTGRDYDIWLSDGRDPASRTLLVKSDGQGWWTPISWSFDGSRLLIGKYISIGETQL